MGFSVASLLMKLRPGEKRQRGRWRPGWRYQKGPGRGFLFRLAKRGQDPVDDVLVLNTTDDPDRPTADHWNPGLTRPGVLVTLSF